jgi:hypothetical protein
MLRALRNRRDVHVKMVPSMPARHCQLVGRPPKGHHRSMLYEEQAKM